MYTGLKDAVDHGANTLSPKIDAAEISLNAYVTFIRCTQSKVFVGLGNGSIQSYAPDQKLSFEVNNVFDTSGLPICVAVDSSDSIFVGTDASSLLKVNETLSHIALHDKGWIEQLAVSATGLIAYSSDKSCYVIKESEPVYTFPRSEGSIMGLQFNSTGSKLALAHYGGVTIWDMDDGRVCEELEWQGAHLNMCWSPDDQYLVTATPDKEIHCWDLSSNSNFRMRGYPAKIRSLCWTADGKHLAVAGADSVTVWPFVNGNPSGKPPYEFGYSFQGIVTVVAAHPSEPIIAAGYNNGNVLIGRYLTGEAIIARAPLGIAISAMDWSTDGQYLFAGTEEGQFNEIHLKELSF